jgi:hypothetical protein
MWNILRWLRSRRAQTSGLGGPASQYPSALRVDKAFEVVPPATPDSAMEAFKPRRTLRELDADIAVTFLFFASADFTSPWDLSPKGFIYGEPGRLRSNQDERRSIPHYSSDQKDFFALEDRVKSWHGELYLQILLEQELNESNATLEQKCRAALQAARRSTTDRV